MSFIFAQIIADYLKENPNLKFTARALAKWVYMRLTLNHVKKNAKFNARFI